MAQQLLPTAEQIRRAEEARSVDARLVKRMLMQYLHTTKRASWMTKPELGTCCAREDQGKDPQGSKTLHDPVPAQSISVYKLVHPSFTIDLTKFISSRPHWVKCLPHQEVCVCTYCAKFQLSRGAEKYDRGFTFCGRCAGFLCMSAAYFPFLRQVRPVPKSGRI